MGTDVIFLLLEVVGKAGEANVLNAAADSVSFVHRGYRGQDDRCLGKGSSELYGFEFGGAVKAAGLENRTLGQGRPAFLHT